MSISTSVFAAQITGTATNGTTNKPAAGDDVVLLSLAAGMDETAHTKTDAQGRFIINIPDEGVQHLVRVIHQGVNYYRAAPPGTTSAEITVYDAAKEVPNILQESRVLRLQTKDGQIEISEAYTLRNESKPPRTKNGDQTFEVTIPEGATLLDGMVAGPGGMPTTSMPAALGKKGHYAFSYPIKPGKSQLQVVYKLPYSGSREFTFKPDVSIAEFGVLLPRSMKFTGVAGNFVADTDEAGMAVFFAKSIAAGEPLTFSVSGEGSAPHETQGTTPVAQPGPPGGGPGAPIDATSSGSSSLYISAAFLVIIAGGAFWLVRRSRKGKLSDSDSNQATLVNSSNDPDRQAVAPQPLRPTLDSGGFLDALKEELFQLESDRLHESISQQEYEKQKAGLDALLRRQMKIPGQGK